MAGTPDRYKVQRTLSYAHTVYGFFPDLETALARAESQSQLGYPSEVIDRQTGESHRPPYWDRTIEGGA